MTSLGYLALGVASFAAAALFDLASLRGWKHAKGVLGPAVVLPMVYATYGVAHTPPRLVLPARLVWLGWPLLGIGLFLLVCSLFLEIPFRQTYTQAGRTDRLVTTGTYALCRHPGVLWFGLVLIALILVSRARLLFIAAPVWFVLDVALAWVEDCYYFPRMFPEYRAYQQEVPMLCPTRESMARCLLTLISDEDDSGNLAAETWAYRR